jgi:import inner membrane translocase subunit TIM8
MSFFGFGKSKAPEPAASGSSPYTTYDEPSYDYSSPAPAASSFETGPSASPSTGGGYGANEVQAMLLEEQQRALIQQAISKITAIAWDKCSAAKPDSDLSSKERECIKNTTLAYLDTSVFVMHRLNKSA